MIDQNRYILKNCSHLALGLLILFFSLPLGLRAQCPPQVNVSGNSLFFDYSPGVIPDNIPTSISTADGTQYTWAFGTSLTTAKYDLVNGTGPVFSLPGSFTYIAHVCSFDATGRVDDFFLPIELTQFTAELDGDDVQLFWETASEENNAGFELERSFNGEDFEIITALPGMGTTNITQSYHFSDRNLKAIALANTVYYRLKHSDWDGKTYYSEIIPVDLKIQIKTFGISKIHIEDQRQIQLYYQTADTKAAILILSDLHGRLVVYEKLKPSKGFNQIRINLPPSAKGMYILHLTNGIEAINRKILISGN